jgi:hypothetical protein
LTLAKGNCGEYGILVICERIYLGQQLKLLEGTPPILDPLWMIDGQNRLALPDHLLDYMNILSSR